MAKKNKNWLRLRWVLVLFLTFLASLSLLLFYLVQGKNIALLHPRGYIAHQQYSLMLFVVAILLIIGIPALVTLYIVAWRYRESNPKTVMSEHKASKSLVATIWIVPTFFMIVISVVMWPATHKLAPQKSIASENKPLTIQVISLRWKWLFLYPEQGIATVNFIQLPINTPVEFEMTADEVPMSSFWIPNLGGQLYTMTSHVNRLNLMANTIGDYPGSTPEINGAGFTGMKFTARVSSDADFNQWVKKTSQSQNILDQNSYKELLKPSEANPVVLYSDFDGTLYDSVIMKYAGSAEGHSGH
ncbi:cytochrome ubiquinol oxidase subunit II [bacterium]|nr:cytochrome ubiquinol oxidase subunit II [bacterium]NBX98175.1 cytochrome ubiquinol oxidase subunit II [bacterium]NDD84412.1 cytochrome ubiquinol oxidase subunit II [bacterium]NDG28973.1 cytochrome ubiquinol oxidase subunit II [bacterium]